MATSPIGGDPLPNTGGTDQVAADMLTYATSAEKKFVNHFTSTSDRDTKIPTGSRRGGMVGWVDSPGKFTYYDATLGAWADLMNPTAWDTWTPTLRGGNSPFTAFNLGSGATQLGRYRVVGKTCSFQATWLFGNSVSGPGGFLTFDMPPGFPAPALSTLQQTGLAVLWVPSLGEEFMGHWILYPNATVAQLYFPKDRGTSSMGRFQDSSDGATASTGIPNITGTSFNYPIQINGALNASGTYQIA